DRYRGSRSAPNGTCSNAARKGNRQGRARPDIGPYGLAGRLAAELADTAEGLRSRARRARGTSAVPTRDAPPSPRPRQRLQPPFDQCLHWIDRALLTAFGQLSMRQARALEVVNQNPFTSRHKMDAPTTILPAAGVRAHLRVTPLRLAVGITLLALLVRVTGLTSRTLWLDEAFSAFFSAQSFHYLWTVLPTYEAHPPFYYSLLKVWRTVFGSDALALRSISVLFGVLTIPLVITAAREHERLCPTGPPLLRR